MALTRVGLVDLPPFRDSGFDHGEVHLASRRIFVAHTAEGTIEVIDGDALVHAGTIPGCPEASGVLCAPDESLVVAAARGAGKVVVIDPGSLAVVSEIATGPRPNGLAWNGRGGTLLVADVEDFRARLHRLDGDEPAGQVELPGRPRWCVYDAAADRFLVNVRDPACVAVIAGEPARIRRPVGSLVGRPSWPRSLCHRRSSIRGLRWWRGLGVGPLDRPRDRQRIHRRSA